MWRWIEDHIESFLMWLMALLAVAFTVLLVAPIGYTIASYQNEEVRTCTVEGKDRTTNSEGQSDMRIYTEQCGNLSVSDAAFRGHFSSSDTYRELEVGKTYEVTTIGFRIPFLSAFPNIVEVEEVSHG